MASACPGVHLHFLLCIVGQHTATTPAQGKCHPGGPGGGDSEKSHDVYTQKDTWDCSATGSASDCHVCFGEEIILGVFSCLVAKDGEAGGVLNGAGKKKKRELHIVPPLLSHTTRKGKSFK